MSVSTMSLLVEGEERAFSFLRDNPAESVECVAHGRLAQLQKVGRPFCGLFFLFSLSLRSCSLVGDSWRERSVLRRHRGR